MNYIKPAKFRKRHEKGRNLFKQIIITYKDIIEFYELDPEDCKLFKLGTKIDLEDKVYTVTWDQLYKIMPDEFQKPEEEDYEPHGPY